VIYSLLTDSKEFLLNCTFFKVNVISLLNIQERRHTVATIT